MPSPKCNRSVGIFSNPSEPARMEPTFLSMAVPNVLSTVALPKLLSIEGESLLTVPKLLSIAGIKHIYIAAASPNFLSMAAPKLFSIVAPMFVS